MTYLKENTVSVTNSTIIGNGTTYNASGKYGTGIVPPNNTFTIAGDPIMSDEVFRLDGKGNVALGDFTISVKDLATCIKLLKKNMLKEFPEEFL